MFINFSFLLSLVHMEDQPTLSVMNRINTTDFAVVASPKQPRTARELLCVALFLECPSVGKTFSDGAVLKIC